MAQVTEAEPLAVCVHTNQGSVGLLRACVTPLGASHETLEEKLLWEHSFGECFYDVSKEINIFRTPV